MDVMVPCAAKLSVEKLCFSVGDFALSDVSLAVGSGEYFVLMGATGSGKSLLVKCICGLAVPTSGAIALNGTNVTRLRPRERRIGYVPQDCGLFPHMDVASNITFGLRVRRISRRKAMQQAQPLIDMLELGSLLGRSTGTLSGGERQKVAVARALAVKPELLILDEPVSALDEPTRHEVCLELRRVQREFNVPVVHICHSVAEARLVADRVGVMVAGRLVQAGPLDEITKTPASPAVARLLGTGESDG